ncbi:MAG: hypothetical protein M3T49_04180 [Candidatus Eremiobacteraeota bacterium]|nr:hypothetical protein [Candidatus Eremiobacteraeota bacterium]
MEVEQALADLEEVRDRLASCQRFRGYSVPATLLSGALAIAAGLVQLAVTPLPATSNDMRAYVFIWVTCLAGALVTYYGSLTAWYVGNAGTQARRQTRSAGAAIAPAIGLGAVLSLALMAHGLISMLPGVWYACYGVGLLSSRAMVPRAIMPAAIGFVVFGSALLLLPHQSLALAWWIMPLGFGVGQLYIGSKLHQAELAEMVV